MAVAATTIERKGTSYTLRPYRDADREGVLSLLEAVWERAYTTDVFDATYGPNPVFDAAPIVVAEADGEIVGVRPYVPYRLRVGDRDLIGVLSQDTSVHPEHQRRGLFTELSELSFSHLRDRGVDFIFSYSNANSRPGARKLGWRYVGRRTAYYRPERATPLFQRRMRPAFARVASAPLWPLIRTHNGVRDRLTDDPSGVSVTVLDGVASADLAALYAQNPPRALHPVCDEAFYEYHFDNPNYGGFQTYLAARGGQSIAGAIVFRQRFPHLDRITLLHAVPAEPTGEWRDGLAAILARMVDDFPDADFFRVTDPSVPRDLLRERGYLTDDRIPFSSHSSKDLNLGVRSLTDEWAPGGQALEEARVLWSFSF